MARVLAVLAVVLGGLALTARPGPADDPKPGKKTDTTAALLEKLRLPAKTNLTPADRLTLAVFAEFVNREHGIPVLINEEAFKAAGIENVSEAEVKVPQTRGL